MKNIIVTVPVLIACSVDAVHIAHADCGPPPQGFSYSANFYKAQRRVYEDTRKKAGSLNLAIPAEIPLQLGAGASDAKLQSGWESLNEATATNYVQKEISDHRVAIVAECGYYMCLQDHPSSDLDLYKAQALTEVCKRALDGSPTEPWRTSGIVIIPDVRYIVFLNQKEATVRARIVNNEHGPLKIKAPLLENPTKDEAIGAPALYLRTSIEKDGGVVNPVFRLDPGKSMDVLFSVRRPTADAGSVVTPLTFEVESSSPTKATITLIAIHSSDEMLPIASIPCGQVNPHAIAECTSDDPKGHPKKTASHDDWSDFPIKAGPVVDYSSNGGSLGRAQYSAICTRFSASRKTASVEFLFDASVGGRCGRNGSNAGGGGGTNPEWKTTLVLPGRSGRQTWSIALAASLSAAHGGSRCAVAVDSKEYPLDVNGNTVKDIKVEPGDHSLRLTCLGDNPWRGCYGANEGTDGMSSESIRVNVSANRTDL